MISVPTCALGLVLWTAAAPVILGLGLLLGRPFPDRWTRIAVFLHAVMFLVLSSGLLWLFWAGPLRSIEVNGPHWLRLGDWAWRPVFLIDRLSTTYVGLIALVYVAIVRFSLAAMVREPGALRYWFLVTLFGFGLVATALAGNLDVLYLGWEWVGITSVMLIGFFRQSVRSNFNSLRTLIYYRLGDLFLLGAAVEIHHLFPGATFSEFSQGAPGDGASLLAAALLVGSLAKSAQLPFSPWLHRAMEGPASSSGVFYGSLSVHLGPFLLLRTGELWMSHSEIRVAMASLGLATALYATLVGRTRPDAKTSLAYATLTQLGLLYVEIALGWHTVALVHMCAHASLRTWQFLRSSSLIQDFQDNPLFRQGVRLTRASGLERRLSPRLQRWLYLAALRQFWLDGIQWFVVARPMLSFFSWLLRQEEKHVGEGVAVRTLFHSALVLGVSGWGWGAVSGTLSLTPGISTFQVLCVIGALAHVGMGMATSSSPRALLSLAFSQIWLILVGAFSQGMGPVAANMLMIGTLAGSLVLGSIVLEIKKRHGVERLAPDNGLSELSPRLGAVMLTMGWLWVGLPGGITFFAEDVLFHALLGHSFAITVGFLLTATLSPIVFYRLYVGLFSGMPRPEILAFPPPPMGFSAKAWSLARTFITVAVLLIGVFPSWFFE